MKTTRGFTLVELLVALVLMGIVAAGILVALNNNQRAYQAQAQTMKMQEEVRGASFVLPIELRELDAADGDIVALSSNDITIKVMRQLGFVCVQPTSPYTGTLITDRARYWGIRWFDPTRDSILIYAPTGPSDGRWLRGRINTELKTTGTCTGGAAGSTLTVSMSGGGNNDLSMVKAGSPVRGFELERLRLYQDSDSRWYFGMLSYSSGAWSTTQPVAGPLTATGMEFQYFDSVGTVTANRLLVRSIAVTVRGMSADRVRGAVGGGGGLRYLQDSVVSRVALRNNPLR